MKLFNLFSKKKINPLIGATGLSAVPMASRVCNEIATKYDPKNHVLNYCMSSNISGVIGSAVAAGVLISVLGINLVSRGKIKKLRHGFTKHAEFLLSFSLRGISFADHFPIFSYRHLFREIRINQVGVCLCP